MQAATPVADVPHFNGLPLAAAARCLEVFPSDRGLAGVVVTEFNALRDPAGSHARRVLDLLVLPLLAT
jgi:hypothetical protein